jgi:hypothetical protein
MDTATGPALDRLIVDRYNLRRQGATAAWVPLEFTRATSSGALLIPSGTTIQSPDQTVRFRTDTELVIADGFDTGSVRGTSTGLGSDQAVEAGVLTQFSGGPPEADLEVTNLERSAGGNDRQSDGDYRAQARGIFVNARRGTLTAIVQGALEVEQVRVASAYEYTDDDGCPSGPVQVIVADAAGNANSELTAEVEEELEEWRAAGIPVEVAGGVRTERAIRFTAAFESGTATGPALQDVRRVIVAYVNRLKARAEATAEEAIAAGVSVLTPGYIETAARTVPRLVAFSVLEPAATEVPEIGEVIRTNLGLVEHVAS